MSLYSCAKHRGEMILQCDGCRMARANISWFYEGDPTRYVDEEFGILPEYDFGTNPENWA